MAEITIHINGRPYEITCDDGQEGHVVDLAAYVDSRLQHIARAGGAYNDPHLLVLTSLILADELAKAGKKNDVADPVSSAAVGGLAPEDLDMMTEALDKLAKRIDGIAEKVQAS